MEEKTNNNNNNNKKFFDLRLWAILGLAILLAFSAGSLFRSAAQERVDTAQDVKIDLRVEKDQHRIDIDDLKKRIKENEELLLELLKKQKS